MILAAVPALAQGPDAPDLRKDAGNYYLKAREYEKARDQYLSALKLDSNYSDAHYNLAVLYFFRLYDYERALYHFVRYVEQNPQGADIEKVKGLAIQALERIEEEERTAYSGVLKEGTIEALQAFAAGHEGSPYAVDALQKVDALKDYENRLRKMKRAVKAAYEEALVKGTPEAMDAFLARYPQAEQSAEAEILKARWTEERKQRQEEAKEAAVVEDPVSAIPVFDELPSVKIEPVVEDVVSTPASVPVVEKSSIKYEAFPPEDEMTEIERDWLHAQREGTRQAYEDFLNIYQKGEEAAAARVLLDELAAKDREAAGEDLSRSKRKALEKYREMLK